MKEYLKSKKTKKKQKQNFPLNKYKFSSNSSSNQNKQFKKATIEPYITKIINRANNKFNNNITFDNKIINSFSSINTINQENKKINQTLKINPNNKIELRYNINSINENSKKNQKISKNSKQLEKFIKNPKNISENSNFQKSTNQYSKSARPISPPIVLENQLEKFKNGINNIIKIIETFENEYINSPKPKTIKDQLNKITFKHNNFHIKNKSHKSSIHKDRNNISSTSNTKQKMNTLLSNNISPNKKFNASQIKIKTNNNISNISNTNPFDRRINYGFLLSQKLRNYNIMTDVNNKENGTLNKNLNIYRKNYRHFSSKINESGKTTTYIKGACFNSPRKYNFDYILKMRKIKNKEGLSNSVHLKSGSNKKISLNKIKVKKNTKHKSSIINSKSTRDIFKFIG